MTCICGYAAKSTTIRCSGVLIITYHCARCQKESREFKLGESLTRHDMVALLKKIHLYNSRQVSESRKLIIDYLERLLDNSTEFSETTKSNRQRLADLWEKRYLKSVLGDDYYR